MSYVKSWAPLTLTLLIKTVWYNIAISDRLHLLMLMFILCMYEGLKENKTYKSTLQGNATLFIF